MATTIGVDFNPAAMAPEVSQESIDTRGLLRKVEQTANASESVPLDAVVSRDQRPELRDLRQAHMAVSNHDRADHLTNTIGELLAQIEILSEQLLSGEGSVQEKAELQAQVDVVREELDAARQEHQQITPSTGSRATLVAKSEDVSPVNMVDKPAATRIAGADEAAGVATEVAKRVEVEAAVFVRAQSAGLQENAISLVG